MSFAANFKRSYKKASGRLRLLLSMRSNLISKFAKTIDEMMVLQIFDIIVAQSRLTLTPQNLRGYRFSDLLIVKDCLKKNVAHETFDNYFEIIQDDKGTRNTNSCMV